MKNSIMKMEKCLGKVGYQITKNNVNSACFTVMYQKKLPDVALKLRNK